MKIDRMKMMQTLEMLQDNIKKLDQIAGELDRERVATISMESFKNFAAPMQHQLDDIREETRSMRQMALALEQICRMVDQCEDRIIDEIEKERIVFQRFSVAKITVSRPQTEYDPLKITW